MPHKFNRSSDVEVDTSAQPMLLADEDASPQQCAGTFFTMGHWSSRAEWVKLEGLRTGTALRIVTCKSDYDADLSLWRPKENAKQVGGCAADFCTGATDKQHMDSLEQLACNGDATSYSQGFDYKAQCGGLQASFGTAYFSGLVREVTAIDVQRGLWVLVGGYYGKTGTAVLTVTTFKSEEVPKDEYGEYMWVGAGAAGLGLTSAAAVLLKKRSRSLVAAAGKAPAQDENFISHAMTHLQTTSGKPVVVSGEI